MNFGLLFDPTGLIRHNQKLAAVGSAPNPRNSFDREELKRILADNARNPLQWMRKDDQAQTNTCAAHAGTSGMENRAAAPSLGKQQPQFSRSFLYLRARWRYTEDTFGRGNLRDEGTSIQSIIDTLMLEGVPEEPVMRWPTWATTKGELDRLCTPQVMQLSAKNKLDAVTFAVPDFDLTVSRIALHDAIVWGTPWPLNNGPGAHATLLLWAEWNSQLNDFVLIGFNSHRQQPIYKLTRKSYIWQIQNSPYGAYHLDGAKNLRFDPTTQDLL